MLRSLFTGISGLNAHQKMLDVTANNIANVNTVGFKSSSTVFEDTLSQTIAGAATTPSGSINAKQVGLGVELAGTNTNFIQGSMQPTGVPSNLAITGNGFFTVMKNGQQVYTREGAFTLDNTGHLMTPDGGQVQDPAGNLLTLPGLVDGTYVSYSIGTDGVVSAVDSTGATTAIGQVGMALFANPNGLVKVGDSNYISSPASGAAQIGAPGTGGRGAVNAGYVEMSNVDLSSELTNLIVAERGFQANSKVVTTSDEILQTLVNLKS
jgi:flagellar hook protein FlgE